MQLGRKASYTVILAALSNFINLINLSMLIGIVDLVTLTKLIQRIKLRESLAGYLLEHRDAVAQSAQLLINRVGDIYLIEIRAGLLNAHALSADDPRGNTDCGRIGRHLVEHHRACGYLGIVAYGEWSEHLSARADHYVVAEGWMALSGMFTGSAERNTLIQRAVIADLSRLSDNDPRAVVDKQSLTYRSTRMDLYSGKKTRGLADKTCGELMSALIQLVCDTVRRDCMQTRV